MVSTTGSSAQYWDWWRKGEDKRELKTRLTLTANSLGVTCLLPSPKVPACPPPNRLPPPEPPALLFSAASKALSLAR